MCARPKQTGKRNDTGTNKEGLVRAVGLTCCMCNSGALNIEEKIFKRVLDSLNSEKT